MEKKGLNNSIGRRSWRSRMRTGICQIRSQSSVHITTVLYRLVFVNVLDFEGSGRVMCESYLSSDSMYKVDGKGDEEIDV